MPMGILPSGILIDKKFFSAEYQIHITIVIWPTTINDKVMPTGILPTGILIDKKFFSSEHPRLRIFHLARF
jgi:hypothetical protein